MIDLNKYKGAYVWSDEIIRELEALRKHTFGLENTIIAASSLNEDKRLKIEVLIRALKNLVEDDCLAYRIEAKEVLAKYQGPRGEEK